jgi:hypothetical protein
MTLTLKTAVAAVALAIGFGSTAYGQSGMLRVDVPFAFHACNKLLPAGTYDMTTTPGTGHVVIASLETTKACYTPAHVSYSTKTSNSTRVAFRQYGEMFFLAGLQFTGSENRVQMLPAAGESELAKTRPAREYVVAARRTR